MEELAEAAPYLIPMAIVTFWFFMHSMLARFSGWSELADHYRAYDSFEGDKRHLQSVNIGLGDWMNVNFNNCITIGADARSLHLSVLFILRPFHPPLTIPLEDIAAEPGETLIFKTVRLRPGRTPGVRIIIPRSQAIWVEQRSERRIVSAI